MVAKSIGKIISKFQAELEKQAFPKVKIYLFGSYARGDARPDSDIDICLVARVFKKNKEKYEKQVVVIAYQIDPRLQIVLTDPYTFQKDNLSPLFSRVRKEAIAA
ncbi:MAG: nucleotidyltransferase domain-containing protein [Pseudomonadota bacterium]